MPIVLLLAIATMKNLDTVSQLLGHSSVQTTILYIGLDTKAKYEAVERRGQSLKISVEGEREMPPRGVEPLFGP